MIRETIDTVTGTFYYLQNQIDSFSLVLSNFKQLYELPNIPKAVIDGKMPFPESTQDLRHGLSIEFKNVSFGYPKNEENRFALKNASFKIEQGQLCVIVGANGSGMLIINLLAFYFDLTLIRQKYFVETPASSLRSY